MAEVRFYHLQRSRLEDVLPALLARTLGLGWKAVVHVSSEERLRALDDHLWTFRDDSFLPHGTPADGSPQTQPILLTTEPGRANGAECLFLVDNAPFPEDDLPARVVVIFDGEDEEQLAAARALWRRVTATGLDASYFQQDERGTFERKR